MISGPNEAHENWCAPASAIRPRMAAKINGAATALARVPSVMAMQAIVYWTRSGCIWAQQ